MMKILAPNDYFMYFKLNAENVQLFLSMLVAGQFILLIIYILIYKIKSILLSLHHSNKYIKRNIKNIHSLFR
jgi:hypothetical protein